jgi:hypothetical protein
LAKGEKFPSFLKGGGLRKQDGGFFSQSKKLVAIEVQHSAQNQLPLFLIPLLADARFSLWQREKNFLLF